MKELFGALGWEYTTPAIVLFVAILIWSMIWKGLALWKSAKNQDKAWFVILLLVNSLGVLEIIYIFVTNKKRNRLNGNEQ